MKIAVTYENGNVFQHFGHTEEFKIYEVEDGKVVSYDVIGTEGSGHEALADFLADRDVNVLICGGCGAGAANALADAGIEVISGAEGSTDLAVASYLSGDLESAGVNCDHHDHEHSHDEGHDCGSCGGGCGGCGGGCGSHGPIIEGENVGKAIKVHYTGTLNDGTQFDSSYDRGEPLEFICGIGMMIPGFDQACANLKAGETIDINIPPELAYGEVNPDAIFTIETAQMPGSEDLEVGAQVYLSNMMGQQFPAKVTAKEGTTITFDTNHELAGQALNFKIEMVEITEM